MNRLSRDDDPDIGDDKHEPLVPRPCLAVLLNCDLGDRMGLPELSGAEESLSASDREPDQLVAPNSLLPQ